MKPTVYIETSVVSYYVSRPSRDVIALAHQEITRNWWDERLSNFRACISPIVIEEAQQGDEQQAKKRLEILSDFEILEANKKVEELTTHYMKELILPHKAIRDAAHLAFACFYDIDFLVSWNCGHIANAEIIRSLAKINEKAKLPIPTICTPEELLGRKEI